MRLENLYQNFGLLPPEGQLAYLTEYRKKRAEDMAKPNTYKFRKTKSTVKRSKIDLSDEEKALMKVLGLKQKDMMMLRDAVTEEEVVEDDASLLSDNSFEEGEQDGD